MENQPPFPPNPNFPGPNRGTNMGNQSYGNYPESTDVPNATAVLVLGIISLVMWFCYAIPGLVCAIIALVLAKKGMDAYNANPSHYRQASFSNLKAGRICAIIGLILGILFFLFWIFVIAMAIMDSSRHSPFRF